MGKSPLSVDKKIEIFVREFSTHFNVTKAAETAGYAKRTAAQAGSRLLKSVKVQALLSGIRAKEREILDQKYAVTNERIRDELVKVAFSNMKQIIKIEDGKPRLISTEDMSDDAAAALKSISYSESSSDGETSSQSSSFSLSMHDKVKALDLLKKRIDDGGDAPKGEVVYDTQWS